MDAKTTMNRLHQICLDEEVPDQKEDSNPNLEHTRATKRSLSASKTVYPMYRA